MIYYKTHGVTPALFPRDSQRYSSVTPALFTALLQRSLRADFEIRTSAFSDFRRLYPQVRTTGRAMPFVSC